jgi:hypothetical protein
MSRFHSRVEQVLVVAVCGLLAAGCGDDGPSDTDLGTADAGPQPDAAGIDQSVANDLGTSDSGSTPVDLGTTPVDLGTTPVDLGTTPVDMGTVVEPTGTCSGTVSIDCAAVSPVDCPSFLASGCTQGAAFCADDPAGATDVPAECATLTSMTQCNASGAYCAWSGGACVASDRCTALSAAQCPGGVDVLVNTSEPYTAHVDCHSVRPCTGTGSFNCGDLTRMNACVGSGCTWTPN